MPTTKVPILTRYCRGINFQFFKISKNFLAVSNLDVEQHGPIQAKLNIESFKPFTQKTKKEKS